MQQLKTHMYAKFEIDWTKNKKALGFKNMVIGSHLKLGPPIVKGAISNFWGGISREILRIFKFCKNHHTQKIQLFHIRPGLISSIIFLFNFFLIYER